MCRDGQAEFNMLMVTIRREVELVTANMWDLH